MNENLEPEDGLTARLRALGQLPVDSATQARHLTAMAEAAAAPTLFGTLGNRVRVAVALVVGFMLGTTGLASAGALGPLQPIASTTLEKVGINVPEGADVGTKRIRNDECTELAGHNDYKNHGQFLKAVRANNGDVAAAAQLDCGKPVASDGENDADIEADDDTKGGKPDDVGKPENPGKSEEKGNSADKAGNADNAGKADKANKGAAADENAGVSENAEADCAGGADNAQPVEGSEVAAAAPSTSAPAMPECAEAQKDANTADDPSADRTASDDSSSDEDGDNEEDTQDTTATEQVPSDADASSDGS